MKVLQKDFGDVRKDFDVLRELDHPHIVRVFEYFEDESHVQVRRVLGRAARPRLRPLRAPLRLRPLWGCRAYFGTVPHLPKPAAGLYTHLRLRRGAPLQVRRGAQLSFCQNWLRVMARFVKGFRRTQLSKELANIATVGTAREAE